MEKKQAITLIEDTFNAKFDEMQFTRFIGELLNDVEPKSNRYSGQMLWDDHKEHINSYKRIGKYIDPEGEPLDVLIVEVKTIAKLERARTSLRNFVIKHLSKFDKDYALVAFYAKEDEGIDWRFSFIKLEHQSYFDEEKDKVKIKKEFTPAKRYSFLVGEYEQSHTAKTQLLPLLQNLANNPTVEDLENAFSIEKVTDEFFEQYKDLFTKLSSHFAKDEHIKQELNKANIDNARFTKKLLGQIVFLYFLQKKGWLGVPQNEKWGKGQKRFIQNLFDNCKRDKENYFKDYLQPLFYEALAKERSNEHSFYKRFNCRIPFLNGGLFEAEYKWETANITIPENLFRNQEKNKAGDIGTGVLDVFDRYNFTIKEDEPLDKEVAVDPEMLGKVFENMLEITERKSKGAFYTPREIVHYMCQESLIHYLDNALDGKVKKQDIETYIRKGHNALENDQRVVRKGEETATYKYILPKSIRENADLIDQKLIDIKICDPAIGSGAFPVGLLHELVNAQLVIKPHFTDKYANTKLKGFGFSKKEAPSESRYIYRLKRHIIQESIYGVDIDASAIDIARLRLWLSLVVDEDDFDPIETLPNLDYKIVCGNSLISRYPLDMPIDNVFKEFNKKVQSKDYQNKAIKNLVGTKEIDLAYYKKLTNDFLLESSHDKKVLFRELISEIKNAFTSTLGNKALKDLSKARGAVENLKQSDIFGKQVGTKTQIGKAKKLLVKLEKEKQETQDGILFKNAVEWRFEFPNLLDESGDFIGFDVVIGNPPYVNIYSIDIKQKGIFKSLFNTAHKKYDLYVLFFEKSISLLKKKGSVNLITSNKYFSQPYGFKLRELFLKNRIIEIVNFRFNIFSATVDTAITHLSKDSSLDNIQILDVKDKNGYNHFTTHSNRVKLNLDFIKSLDEFLFRVEVSEVDIRIINMIKKISYKFSDICYINYGCRLVSKNGDKKKSDYIYTDNEQGIYKKFIEGRDIRKFEIISYKYVDYRPKEHYLSLFTELFDNAKLVSKDVVGKDGITVAFDSYGFYDDHTTINAVKWSELKNITYSGVLRNISKTNIELSEKFNYYELLGFINSEISNYYFNKLYNLDLHFYPGTFQNMIIPKNRFNNYSVIIEYILEAKKNNLDIIIKTFFESVSNAIVYELYFKQELKQANKQVLKHLTSLKPINDTMSEEEKLAIIQSEFERLYHPEHPVRFAIETLDSIEEVRIIKEALR